MTFLIIGTSDEILGYKRTLTGAKALVKAIQENEKNFPEQKRIYIFKAEEVGRYEINGLKIIKSDYEIKKEEEKK